MREGGGLEGIKRGGREDTFEEGDKGWCWWRRGGGAAKE